MLAVSEFTRARIRERGIVHDFVEGRLVPNQPYPHHAVGDHYVSTASDAQLVEWSIEFVFVTRTIVDQGGGG